MRVKVGKLVVSVNTKTGDSYYAPFWKASNEPLCRWYTVGSRFGVLHKRVVTYVVIRRIMHMSGRIGPAAISGVCREQASELSGVAFLRSGTKLSKQAMPNLASLKGTRLYLLAVSPTSSRN